MKSNILYLGLIIFINYYGCRSPQKTDSKAENKTENCRELSIDLTNSDLKSEECIFKDITFTKLETTDQSLLNNAGKVIHFDNKLFIQTTLERGISVLVFKDSGEFIFKIVQGRAPDEVIYPSAIAIDKKNKLLLVLDRYRVLKAFDFNGKFVKGTTFNADNMYFESLGDHLVFFDGNLNQKMGSGYYATITKDKEIISKFMPKNIDIRCVLSHPFFKINEDSLLVSCCLSDTIFCVSEKGNRVAPFYILDYKGRSTNNQLDKISDIYNYMEICNSQNYGSGVESLVKSKDRLFFKITAKENYFVVYDLKKNTPTLHTRLFDSLPNNYAIAGFDGECIIFSYTVPWLLEYFEENKPSDNDSQIIRELRTACVNEDDNPILLFCKF